MAKTNSVDPTIHARDGKFLKAICPIHSGEYTFETHNTMKI